MGMGGANAVAVVKPYPIPITKSFRRSKHRLVLISGRTSQAIDTFINGIQRNREDQEFLALLDEIHKLNIKGHPYRG